MKLQQQALATLLACSVITIPSIADDQVTKAIKDGKVKLNFRLRYEDVNDDISDGTDTDAEAFTLRTRLSYTTAPLHGFNAQIEMDNVTELDSVDYKTHPSNSDADLADKSVISDPESTEINQVWLNYNVKKTDLRYGRQRLNLDNQRYIGGVGFRQNEQTYLATTVASKSFKDVEIYLGYISQVRRIWGEDRTDGEPDNLGKHDHSSKYANISYSGLPHTKATLYHYDLDNEESNATAMSTKTTGLRITGKYDHFGYALEYARQSDAHDNTKRYDANYTLFEAYGKIDDFTLKVGQETLEADGSDGFFVTPLATLHKFQGWTDRFLGGGLGNVAGGIEDTYASFTYTYEGFNLALVIHDFASDTKSAATGMASDYGDEWGISISKKFAKRYGLSLKYADFDADSDWSTTDTTKLWLTATANF